MTPNELITLSAASILAGMWAADRRRPITGDNAIIDMRHAVKAARLLSRVVLEDQKWQDGEKEWLDKVRATNAPG